MDKLVTVLKDRIRLIDQEIKALVEDRKTTIAHIELEDAEFKASSLKEYTLVTTNTVAKGSCADRVQPAGLPKLKATRGYISTAEYRLDESREALSLVDLCNTHGMTYNRKTVRPVLLRLVETGHIQVLHGKFYPTQLGKEFIGMKVSSPSLHFYTNSFKELVRGTNINNL